MEKVMIISTGGTIVSVDKGGGAVPDAEAARSVVAPALDYLRGRGVECAPVEAFGSAGVDSSDMSPEEWLAFSRIIARGRAEGVKKFLVVHGTDTMAFSAAWLSLTVRGAAVVLTGSQRTPGEEGFDGADNLLGAAKLLLETESGVLIYFAGEKFPGAYVHKEDSSALCAYVRTGGGASPCFGLPAQAVETREAARKLAVVYLHPAYSGGFPRGARILVLCGYGAGNMAQRLHDELEAAYEGAERPVIIAASSCAKGEKNPSRYGGVGMAELAGRNFTVFGQGSYSLEFLITLSYLALLSGGEHPEELLGRCLEKFNERVEAGLMASENKNLNFIEEIITADIESGRVKEVITRFPPEPNGYLHIGHAKSICLNFGTAKEFGGRCNLRFDDTNPAKEETEYVESIMEDVKWLGFEWANLCYASDYFEQFHKWAIDLIKAGKAYVDDQSAEEIRTNRGTLTKPGVDSPYRNRSVEENLDLFARMTAGEFEEGSHVLRAKIDMASKNLNMRDPVIYRILKREHHRTGAKWCVYPMYDFAHGYEDAIEGVTHSICTLEFQDHRPLYDWFIDNVDVPHVPHQYEFARLNLTYTVMSKRKLLELVTLGIVSGWDDPRMPTICGFRRRGYTASSIRRFCREVGVAKADSLVEIELLQHCLREELNKTALRGMAVLDPVKLVIENWPEGFVDELDAENNPEDASAGSRKVRIGREIFIERGDFMEEPVKGFFRLSPGKEVRLKYAYLVTCTGVVKDENGRITEIRCKADMDSRGGDAPDGRKVKGTLHWVWAGDAVPATVNLYGNLFTLRNMNDMEEGKDYKDYLNPESLRVAEGALVEPSLAKAAPLDKFQFLRHGYFCADTATTQEKPVFNLTVSLKDSWGKEQKKQG